ISTGLRAFGFATTLSARSEWPLLLRAAEPFLLRWPTRISTGLRAFGFASTLSARSEGPLILRAAEPFLPGWPTRFPTGLRAFVALIAAFAAERTTFAIRSFRPRRTVCAIVLATPERGPRWRS